MPTESWQTTFREKVSVVAGILWGFVTDSCWVCINSVLRIVRAGADKIVIDPIDQIGPIIARLLLLLIISHFPRS